MSGSLFDSSNLEICSLRRIVTFLFAIIFIPAFAHGEVIQNFLFTPGDASENGILLKSINSSVNASARTANPGGVWVWGLVTPPSARCVLNFDTDTTPHVDVSLPNGKMIPSRSEQSGSHWSVYASTPANFPVGGRLHFRFRALETAISVQNIIYSIHLADSNGDGLSDFSERLMGLLPGQHATLNQLPRKPHTAIHIAEPWSPSRAFPADEAISTPENLQALATWSAHGYKTLSTPDIPFPASQPVLSAGDRSVRPFEDAFLAYSQLAASFPASSNSYLPAYPQFAASAGINTIQSNWQEKLVAALLTRNANCVEILHDLSASAALPPDMETILKTLSGNLSNQWIFNSTMDAGSYGIAFVPHITPNPSEEPMSCGMPLIQHGIPAQAIPADNLQNPGALNDIRTLILPSDMLPASNSAAIQNVGAWVKGGGVLLLLGGGNLSSLTSMWNSLGLGSAPELNQMQVPAPQVTPELVAESKTVSASQNITIDISRWISPSGSVTIQFDCEPDDTADGFRLNTLILNFNNRMALSFEAGSELESRFLQNESGTIISQENRIAQPSPGIHPFFSYHFDHLPQNTKISLIFNIGGRYRISAIPEPSSNININAINPSFGPLLAHLSVTPGEIFPLISPPAGSQSLYNITGQSNPLIWTAPAANGFILYAGISPDFFSLNMQRSLLLRALVKMAYGLKGYSYHESPYYLLTQGPWKTVHTLGHNLTLDGHYVNMLSPTLAAVEYPTLPPHTDGIYKQFTPAPRLPVLLAVSGKLTAMSDQTGFTSFIVSGTGSGYGYARIWKGVRSISGARAFTLFGQPVPVSIFPDSNTILVRYQDNSDGVILKIGWK
jgi:hypothetical protein